MLKSIKICVSVDLANTNKMYLILDNN